MEDSGIVSSEERKEWMHKNQGDADARAHNNASLVIAGINADNDRWKTSYKRFESQEKTSKDQLILVKRAGTRRPLEDPAQIKSIRTYLEGDVNVITGENSNRTHASPRSQYAASTTVAPVANAARGKSFLSNIGAAIAEKIPDSTTVLSSPAPLVNARSMLSENYNPYPGTCLVLC